mgnify:CR=1 FL=1
MLDWVVVKHLGKISVVEFDVSSITRFWLLERVQIDF